MLKTLSKQQFPVQPSRWSCEYWIIKSRWIFYIWKRHRSRSISASIEREGI